MRHPYNEAGGELFDFGPGQTGLGSGGGGANTVQWSIRTIGDVAVAGFDWTTGVAEIGTRGAYLVLFPANFTNTPGRYLLSCRTAAASGKRLDAALEITVPDVDGAAFTPTVADRIDADISTRATPADVDVQVEADVAAIVSDLTAIKAVTDQVPLVRTPS